MITDSDIQTTRKLTVHADKVPLSEILDYVARNLGVAFYLGRDVIWVTQAQPSKEPATPMETRIYRLRKGLSEQELTEGQINIESAITRFVPGIQPSDLLFDPKAHVLIVKGLRADLAKVEDIIASLDVCPPQVLIEARFMMTAVTDLRELGIDWLLSPMVLTTEGGTKPVGLISGNPSYFTPFENQNYGLNLTYQALLTDPMFQAVLHALEMSGNTRTLSVPKVTTVNNRKATITMGEEFRWFEQFDIQSVPSSTTDAGSTIYASRLVPVGSPQTKQLGITLEVTPSVGADLRTITLNLLPSIDEFVRFEIYQTGDTTGSSGTTTNGGSLVKLPIFATRKIDTQVIVQSGETVVMGGLITTSEARDVSRVPVLGAIPLLGGLFRHDTVNERKENLLIFVTATIISERGEQLIATEQISGESRGRALPVTPPVGN
jgi:type IV pilus assembly protein PilQ